LSRSSYRYLLFGRFWSAHEPAHGKICRSPEHLKVFNIVLQGTLLTMGATIGVASRSDIGRVTDGGNQSVFELNRLLDTVKR
jgi:hypothetical protein